MSNVLKPSMTAAKLLRVVSSEPATVKQLAERAGIPDSALHGCRQAAARLVKLNALECTVPPLTAGRRTEHLYAITDAGRRLRSEVDGGRALTARDNTPSLNVGSQRILLTPGEAQRLKAVLEMLRAI